MLELRRPERHRTLTPLAGLVDRPRLINHLQRATTPVVLLNAPSGYGKSVLLSQWAAQDPRRFESIVLTDQHNDPALLVNAIAEALERIEPLPAHASAVLSSPGTNVAQPGVPLLCDVLAERETDFVLLLDDLEQIESPQSLSVVSTIGSRLRRGSRLAMATRTDPALPIGRLRAHRGLTELGRTELVMNKAECQALLAGLGLQPNAKQLDVLVRKTEGWPAALYLAGLALADQPDLGKAVAEFAGDDRIVVDYIREEFLGELSRRRLEFLRQVSILDRLSGGLCDAVLERTGSAGVLRDLSHSNMLLMALDRRDEWFRFHALLREMLRAELHRIEPASEAELHRRASLWWADHGDPAEAIGHAIEGGDTARAGQLLWRVYPEYSSRGRQVSITRWLDRLGPEAVGSDPYLSLTAAFGSVSRGAGSQADHWTAVAGGLCGALPASPEKDELMRGLALVNAALARHGVKAMVKDAARGADGLPEASPWFSMCRLLEGVGLHLQGLQGESREKLDEAARRGAVAAPTIQVLSLAQLTLLAIEEDDWQAAEALSSQARGQLERVGIDAYPTMALGVAASALVRSHTGPIEKSWADLRKALGLVGELDEFGAWYEAEARVVLARAAVRLDDAPTATRMLDEATRFLRQIPDAPVLDEWIEQTREAVETVSVSGVADLTLAELRVLRHMPTHLSFAEIAEAIFVSSNTVKTQAQGVYRKLDVSSRGEAVDVARRIGLIDEAPPGDPSAP
jgi:LuxR family transcriptional regulator, maltose regulon positive regulatory protein